MRRRLVAANWKSNGSLAFIDDYVATLGSAIDLEIASDELDIVVFPPSAYLLAFRDRGLVYGAQDVGISPSGAHTGELAAEMITDVGGEWVIVGHSERRIDQGEPDDLVATKAAAALRGGLKPIVCVGETLDERNAGHEIAVVERQLEAVLDRIEPDALVVGAVAYEPVWAIGTGETASPEQAQEMHAFIRDKIAHVDRDAAAAIRLLYGGSVKPDNAKTLFDQEDIDGGLIGGAGLDPNQFAEVLQAVTSG